MGRKRVRTRQHIFCAVAILISIILTGCATTEGKQKEPEKVLLYVEPIHPAVV